MLKSVVVLSALLGLTGAPLTIPPASPPELIGTGVYLLPGRVLPGRGPDGNTILLRGPQGLVVTDTGRHKAHSDAILKFAESQQVQIAAIINTHWHLDHTSGNERIKAAFPQAKVYASTAVDRALGGFLARDLQAVTPMLDDPKTAPLTRDEINIFVATMRATEHLRPDVPVTSSSPVIVAGRDLDVRLAPYAATDGDVWFIDRETKIAVVGDLVTLPVPYLDTACPDGWLKALDSILATEFTAAIPGHGPALTPAQIAIYRDALTAYVACANGTEALATCTAAWTGKASPLIGNDPKQLKAMAPALEYYAGMLRKNGGKAPFCAAHSS